MAEFLGMPMARLEELRQPVDLVFAYAMTKATGLYMTDDSVSPTDLVAIVIDSHARGLASAVQASRREDAVPGDIADQAIARFRHHMEEIARG